MGGQSGNYYLDLASEDYYLKGGEPPGIWYGLGAETLGLFGLVSREQFLNLFNGYSPDGSTKLTQNAGQDTHHPGWDLTFSAPKSVSTLWSQADSETRQAIQEAHRNAVGSALSYLQENALITKRSHGGIDKERARGLIVATFEHGTSRAQDPQLHTHALVMNAATRFDNSTGTILGKPLFEEKMTAGAVYRAELAARLEHALGVQIERVKNLFEVRGVPKALIEEFSTRRKEIEEDLAARGFHGAKASAISALTTREAKEHIAREKLFESWQEIGHKHGFGIEETNFILHSKRAPELTPQALDKLLTSTADLLTRQQSYFSESAFIRKLSEEAPGQGLSAKDIILATRHHLDNSTQIVRLGDFEGRRYYTTEEMCRIENSIIEHAFGSKNSGAHKLTELSVKKALEKMKERFGYALSDEQKRALFHITTHEGSIQIASGMAGTGKTAMLSAAREAWEREGFTVIGAALAGKAAKGLEQGTEIKSSTIAKLLRSLEPESHEGALDLKKGKPLSVTRALGKEEKGAQTFQPLHFDEKTVLVIDEAAMVDSRQMAKLIEHTTRAGAKLVLVGDEKQLQPIESGGSFKALGQILGRAELSEIKRQKEDWAREAVHDMAFGRSKEALEAFAKRGLLSVSESRIDAMNKLITDWKQEGLARPNECLIITGTRLEATVLNRMAQAERLAAGKLEPQSCSIANETYHIGDRILFTKNSAKLGVTNGSTGTLLSIEPMVKTPKLSIQLDTGEVVVVNTRTYDNLLLGYAITTHKGQGETVNHAFILAGGTMQDRELSYVQVSRARLKTHIYTDRLEAGDNLSELTRQMAISREKELALEFARRIQEDPNSPTHSL